MADMSLEAELQDLRDYSATLDNMNRTLMNDLKSQQKTNDALLKFQLDQNKMLNALHKEVALLREKNNDASSVMVDVDAESISELGPSSKPFNWVGKVTDLIQLRVNGQDANAIIFTQRMISDWNKLTNITFRVNEYNLHINKEEKHSKEMADFLQGNHEMHYMNDPKTKYINGQYMRGDHVLDWDDVPLTEEQVQFFKSEFKDSRDRIQKLMPLHDAAFNEMQPLRAKMERKIRKPLMKAGLFKWPVEPDWLKALWDTKKDKRSCFWKDDEESRLECEELIEDDSADEGYKPVRRR